MVTPLARVMAQWVAAGIVAVSAVSVMAAAAVPELAIAAVKSVVPQPTVVMPEIEVRVKSGNTNVMVSDASRGALSSNSSAIEDASDTIGLETRIILVVTAGDMIAVDASTAVAGTLVCDASVAAAVRVLASAF